jgi:DNA-binding response OmpR family regulator
VLILRVRKKFEDVPKKPKVIITVAGSGYKFSEPT